MTFFSSLSNFSRFLFLVLSILMLSAGHFFRVMRWRQYLAPFAQCRYSKLYLALSSGYFINFLLPFRLGELARAFIAARGTGLHFVYSFVTVIIDRFLDTLVCFLIFTIILAYDFTAKRVVSEPLLNVYPVLLTLVLVIAILILILYRKNVYFRRFLFATTWLFNDKIRYLLMFTYWCLYQCKELQKKYIRIKYALMLTLIMWTFYIASIIFLFCSLNTGATHMRFINLFIDIYASRSLMTAGYLITRNIAAASTSNMIFIAAYFIVPLFIILLYRSIPAQRLLAPISNRINARLDPLAADELGFSLVPYIHKEEQLKFFEQFLLNRHPSDYLASLEYARGIHIIRDISGGSNATTLLAVRRDKLFFRKYAVGPESAKLFKQYQWIEQHKGSLPLPRVLDFRSREGYFHYDMEHLGEIIPLFEFIHTKTERQSWEMIQGILKDIDTRLHAPTRKELPSQAKEDLIGAYYETKYERNMASVQKHSHLQSFFAYEAININGRAYRNLPLLTPHFTRELFSELLRNDPICQLHGDLTVENIICDKTRHGGYYLIDPNPENILNSAFIDYAKLRQSLNLGYEFLVRNLFIESQGNAVSFSETTSKQYDVLSAQFDEYLKQRFGMAGYRSIRLHELMHYVRMLPYKIKRGPEVVIPFLSACVILHNSFYEEFIHGQD